MPNAGLYMPHLILIKFKVALEFCAINRKIQPQMQKLRVCIMADAKKMAYDVSRAGPGHGTSPLYRGDQGFR